MGGRTSLPPYKLCGPISSLVFNKSLSNLASLLIPARTFFPAVLKDFRSPLVILKVEKTVEGLIYPVVLLAGA